MIVTQAATPYLTPTEVRAMATADGGNLYAPSAVDAVLEAQIQAAADTIDGWLGHPLQARIIREQYRGTGTNMLRLNYFPLCLGNNVALSAPTALIDTTLHVASVCGVLVGHYLSLNTLPAAAVFVGVVTAVDPVANTLTLDRAINMLLSSATLLATFPVDYINLLVPGRQPYALVFSNLIIDYDRGTVQNFSPLYLQTLALRASFPKGVPLEVQYTAGYAVIPAPFKRLVYELLEERALSVSSPARGGVQSQRTLDEARVYVVPGKGGTTPGHLTDDGKRVLRQYQCAIGVY